MDNINWKATKDETAVAIQIAKRAFKMAYEFGIKDYPFEVVIMDILATHLNGCPLKLSELAESDDANFGHDIFGIRRHLNRKTGKLENCFLPRYAQPEVT